MMWKIPLSRPRIELLYRQIMANHGIPVLAAMLPGYVPLASETRIMEMSIQHGDRKFWLRASGLANGKISILTQPAPIEPLNRDIASHGINNSPRKPF